MWACRIHPQAHGGTAELAMDEHCTRWLEPVCFEIEGGGHSWHNAQCATPKTQRAWKQQRTLHGMSTGKRAANGSTAADALGGSRLAAVAAARSLVRRWLLT